MTSKKRFLRVEETLEYIQSLEEKGVRKNELIGFRSADASKELKNIISICTSLSVILMQYDLFHVALDVLKKAIENDEKLLKIGTPNDKLWPGRLNIFTNLCFLYQRLGAIEESYKFAIEAQSFLLTLSEHKIPIHEDMKIGSDMITFVVLWLCGTPKDASIYLDSAARSVNTIIKGTPTKLNKGDIQNLYGLIVCSLAALSVKMGGDTLKAIDLCEKCIKEFKSDNVICGMIEKVILILKEQDTSVVNKHIEFNPGVKDPGSFQVGVLIEDPLNVPLSNEEDWLANKVYLKILLEAAFYPIISPSTPALKKEELEFEQAKTKILDIIEDSQTNVLDKRNSSSVPRKTYTRNSPKRTTASVLKSRGPSQPWWKNNNFMEQMFKKSVIKRKESSVMRTRKKKTRAEQMFKKSVIKRKESSVMRTRKKKTQDLPPVEPQIKDIYAPRLSPRRSLPRRREAKKSSPDNERIMIEFNPKEFKEGEKVPLTLVPITPSRKK
ncbi:hypothetical protein SteCoe_2801 [Stentor coeruleus]|uniref:Uncharacterized protein n=1 Tax=Stentor coeruleus TaxID=5963 RepID=A0A1R2CYT8_9CILI|nr:hypothetical protein SteCoe_2801 [Stentor coeruleus]